MGSMQAADDRPGPGCQKKDEKACIGSRTSATHAAELCIIGMPCCHGGLWSACCACTAANPEQPLIAEQLQGRSLLQEKAGSKSASSRKARHTHAAHS